MKRQVSFVCLGDSLTAGAPGFSGFSGWSGNPQSQYEYWLERLVQQHVPDRDVEIANFGVGGNTIWQMQYRFTRDVLRLMPDPDFVILMGGINDLLGHGASSQDVIGDYSELTSLIYDAGARLVAMEIAPATVSKTYVTRIKEVNLGIREIARSRLAPVVPIYAALQDALGMGLNPAYDIGDGVHFNVAGYQHIGEAIFTSCLQRILAE